MLLQIGKIVILQSALGAVLTLVLLLLKPVTKRVFGSRWQYYIWLCVLAVMIVPPLTGGSSTGTTDVLQATAPKDSFISEQAGLIIPGEATLQPNSETVLVNTIPLQYRSLEIGRGLHIHPYAVLAFVWLAGVIVFILHMVLTYIRFLRLIKRHSVPVKCPMLDRVKEDMRTKSDIRVWITPYLNAPVLSGFVKPTLYLPDRALSDEDLQHVLLHELTHHKRRDSWYKGLAMLVQAIHWFNPLMYAVVRQINEECEISCDLAVVREMSMEERKAYMSTLLNMMTLPDKPASHALTSAMSGGKKMIKRRFEMISKAQRLTNLRATVSAILAVALLSATLFAGHALAAKGKEGLESWKHNEIYSRDGIQFSVQVSRNNVPSWVFEDVAGKDGRIAVTLKRVQIRDVTGQVDEHAILELKGTRGTTRLSNDNAEGFNAFHDSPLQKALKLPQTAKRAYTSGYRFSEFNNEGYVGYRHSPIAALVTENSAKHKSVGVSFIFGEDETLSGAAVQFLVANEFDNVDSSLLQKAAFVQAAAESISFIGHFEQDYVAWAKVLEAPAYFTFFEKHFVNEKVPGMEIAVASATTEGITIKTSLSHPKAFSYAIYVYNRNERLISSWESKTNAARTVVMKPTQIHSLSEGEWIDVTTNDLIGGEVYRVDTVVFDRAHNVIYRQREHVKLP
jgi:beta-lactamase regulating signal transducer with metallopeptidase domain